jgi:hypothetical protein
MLRCADLRLDEAIQPRECLDGATITAYAEIYEAAEPGQEPFPPLDVFDVEGTYYVADGFHRLEAARRVGLETFPCHVHVGTIRDAMIFACFANVRRGLRYHHGDWGRILERLLRDPEMAQRKDRQLAEELGVSHVYVWQVRQRVQAEARLQAELAQLPTTATTPATRTQERLAQYLDLPVEALQDLEAQRGPYTSPRSATTPALIRTLVHDVAEGHGSPREVAQRLKEDITRRLRDTPPPETRPARPSRSKEATQARQAKEERETLARALHGILWQLQEVYPWNADEPAHADAAWVEEEAEDGPKLRAKAQAMVAAILPKDLLMYDGDFQIARLVFAALDAAWQARMQAAGAGVS